MRTSFRRSSLGIAIPVCATLAFAGCGGEPPPDDLEGGETTARVELVVPALTDATEESGLDFVHTTGAAGDKWMPETVGSGGGFLDFDGDGHLDIFLVNGRSWTADDGARSALYRNRGDGSFVEVGVETGTDLHLYGMGAAFADYDGDGRIDIYVTAVGPNVLLRNAGDRFVDVTDQAGVDGNPEGRSDAWSTAAAWLDYDGDGDLDLFVCNYVRWTPETDLFHTLDGTTKAYATPEPYEGETCVMYRNEGPGQSFTDVTREAGLWNPEGKALGIAVDDFDDDGKPDIVVTNDTEPNFLYMNRGDGRFEEVGVRAGVAFDPTGRARAGMGVDVADLEGDGRLAIAIGNFSHEAVSLYVQQSVDLFHDRAPTMDLARPTLPMLTFGLRFVDLNLDGFDDIVLANGHIEPTVGTVRRGVSFEQPAQVFLRTGGGFVDMTERTGDAMGRPVVGRGLATGDMDGDGDPDILLTVNGGPARLVRNDLPVDSNRLRVVFDPPVVGARVQVYGGGRHQRWYVTGSGSYLSQSEISARTFGLGDAEVADSVVVRWPDGRRSVYGEGLAAGAVLLVDREAAE